MNNHSRSTKERYCGIPAAGARLSDIQPSMNHMIRTTSGFLGRCYRDKEGHEDDRNQGLHQHKHFSVQDEVGPEFPDVLRVNEGYEPALRK